MKKLRLLALAGTLCLAFVATTGLAQDAGNKGPNKGPQPNNNDNGKPAKPTPPKPQLPPDVQKLIDAAKALKDQYMQQQADLRKQLGAATTADQKQQIRDQMQAARDAFLDQYKAQLQEIRERLKEIRAEFKNNRDKVVNAGGQPGKGPRGR